jgi:ATP-dependent DNA helicase RecG
VGILDTEKVTKALWNGLNDRKRISHNLLKNDWVRVVETKDGKRIIVINIPRARRPQRPVYVGENPMTGTYRRNYEGDYLCDAETVKRMLAEQVEDARDAKIAPGFALRDLDGESVRAYRSQFRDVRPTHPWNDHDDTEFLRCIGGWGRDRQNTEFEGPTIAGLLMFGTLRP